MKNFNGKNKKYYIISVVLIILGIIALSLLMKPLIVGSEERDCVTYTKTTETTTSSTTTHTNSTSRTNKSHCSLLITTTTTTTAQTLNTTVNVTAETSTTITTSNDIANHEESVVLNDDTEGNIIVDNVPEDALYVVYKPSTHYVHDSNCHWVDNSCERIESTEGIECRKCQECNPDIDIVNEYVEPVVETPAYSIDSYSRYLLAEIVWHEAGSDWIDIYSKAKIASAVMNRVHDSRFPDSVYAVLTAPNQFSGYYPGNYSPAQVCYDAVDYYFSHTNEFNCDNSWWGDGRQNYFYYQ